MHTCMCKYINIFVFGLLPSNPQASDFAAAPLVHRRLTNTVTGESQVYSNCMTLDLLTPTAGC